MSAPNAAKRPKVSEKDKKPPQVEVSNPSPTATATPAQNSTPNPSPNPAPANVTSRRRTADQMMPPLEIQIPPSPPSYPPGIVRNGVFQSMDYLRMHMWPQPIMTPPMEPFPGACWIPSPPTPSSAPSNHGAGNTMARCHQLCTLAGGVSQLYDRYWGMGQPATPMAPPYDIRIDMKPAVYKYPKAGSIYNHPVYQEKLRDLKKYKEFMERSLSYYRVTEGAYTSTVKRLEAVLDTVDRAELEAGSITLEALETCEKMLQRTMRSAYYQFVKPPFKFRLYDEDEIYDDESTFDEDDIEENFERLQEIIMNKMRIPPASVGRHVLDFRRPSHMASLPVATSTGTGCGRGRLGFHRRNPSVEEVMAMDLEQDTAPILTPEMETDEDLPSVVKDELKLLNRMRYKVDFKGKREDGSVDLEITLMNPLAPKLAPLKIQVPVGYPEQNIIINLEGRGEDPSTTDLVNEKEVADFFKDIWDMVCPMKKLSSLMMTWEGVVRRFGKLKPKPGRNARDASGVPAAAAGASNNGAQGSSAGL